ncbi:MAG: tyrosine-type recombinase/integrase [Bacteroidales bacterium]
MTGGFKAYRQKKGYSEKSIRVQDSHIKRFKIWCITQSINPETITYNQVLQFIDSERARGILNQSIIREINSIKIYFDYLVQSGRVQHNAISRIRIRQRQGRVLTGTLSSEQLENVYRDYANLPQWIHHSKRTKQLHHRNLVILGLLVYQGITSGEVARLERSHVNLNEGKVYIPSSRKSNARRLKLQAGQIMALQEYIGNSLSQYRQSRENYLFPGKKHSDIVASIIKQVKRIHLEVTDARQIRASVIMNWLKLHNIRQVQYMAGHKSIRSTEQYRSQDLSNLTRQLELFHPLG